MSCSIKSIYMLLTCSVFGIYFIHFPDLSLALMILNHYDISLLTFRIIALLVHPSCYFSIVEVGNN